MADPRPHAPLLHNRLVAVVLGTLIVVPFLLRLPLLERRGFGPDEFEHLHFAWSVSQGQVPYRDYFDHHTPALHVVLSPLFTFYRADTSSADALAAVFAARRVMWVFAAAALGLTFALARLWRGDREAWAGTLLLAGTWIFLAKTLEVRPDVPATALMVGGLLLALSGWRRLATARPGAVALFLLSGTALGATFLFTQKVLFLLPGVAAAELWMLASRRLAATRGARVRGIAAQAVGFLLPIALTLAWFWRHGALGAFIECNFVINARWPGLGPREFVLRLLGDDPAFVALSAAGFARQARTLLRAEEVARGEPLLALAFLAPVASLLVHPAVTFHYFLLLLPQASLYGGAALVWLADGLAAAIGRRSAGPLSLAVLAILVSVHPLVRFARMLDGSNWHAQEGIRYVTRNSAPWETTFDGFSGLGLFRPQAFYHPFQHWHTLAIQTDAQRRHLAEALRTGAALPKLVFLDDYLREGAPPEVTRFLERHYARTGLEPIRARTFDNGLGWWSDEGPRYLGWVRGQEKAPHVLFGDGWRDPGVEGGVPSRRTRTRSSDLIVPIRDPGDFRVIVRAKADAQGLPFDVELLANGVPCGRAPAAPRWQEYQFLARQRDLRPGLNDFKLRLVPSDAAPEGRREVAVAVLALHRVDTLSGRTVDSPTPRARGPQ